MLLRALNICVSMKVKIRSVESQKSCFHLWLRICIFTGDQQHHLSIPRRGDMVQQNDNSFRLLTTALMSHHVWSEPSDVEVYYLPYPCIFGANLIITFAYDNRAF